LITSTAASCGQGVGLGKGTGILCVFVFVIFKTGKLCRFGYVLVAPFSKLENNAKKWVWVWVWMWMWMWVWVLLYWCGCLEPSHLSKSGEKLLTLGMH
jgi:hypothetical protein